MDPLLDAIAFARTTRVPRWMASRGDRPRPAQLLVISGGDRETLHCLGCLMGAVIWRRAFEGVLAPLASDDERVYVGCSDGTVTAVNRADGETVWTYHARSFAAPWRLGSAVFVSTMEGDFIELEAATGVIARKVKTEGGFAVPIAGIGAFWLSHQQGRVTCLDGKTLKPVWARTFEAPLASGVLGGGASVIVPLSDGRLHALNQAGEWIWREEGLRLQVRPAILGAHLVACRPPQGLVAFSLATGHGRLLYELADVQSLAAIPRGNSAALAVDTGDAIAVINPDATPARTSRPIKGVPLQRLRFEEGLLVTVRADADGSRVFGMDASLEARWVAPLL